MHGGSSGIGTVAIRTGRERMARTRSRAPRPGGGSARGAEDATTGYEAELWRMADTLRGSMDAAEYKKAPGEYRRTPNWIGPPGCTIDEATFVPIGADKLPDAMSAWERYIHRNAADRLVQLAVLHAEFEALHPFLDGNGRLGRMLVPPVPVAA